MFLKAFKNNQRGAVAVETAMTLPFLALGLILALDMGITVHKKNSMAKITKSGIQYVINGGRSESEAFNIMRSASGKQIPSSELSLEAYCGCVAPDQSSGGGGEGDTIDPKYAYTYVKTSTDLSADMCPAACSGGEPASALVEIEYTSDVRGVVKIRTLQTSLQARVE